MRYEFFKNLVLTFLYFSFMIGAACSLVLIFVTGHPFIFICFTMLFMFIAIYIGLKADPQYYSSSDSGFDGTDGY